LLVGLAEGQPSWLSAFPFLSLEAFGAFGASLPTAIATFVYL